MLEELEIVPIRTYYKLFIGTNPPKFNGRDGEDKAASRLVEIIKAFDVIELSDKLKIKYGTYILVEDVESLWWTQLAIRYGNMHLNWEEFVDMFRWTYIPPVARERKVWEFLELS